MLEYIGFTLESQHILPHFTNEVKSAPPFKGYNDVAVLRIVTVENVLKQLIKPLNRETSLQAGMRGSLVS